MKRFALFAIVALMAGCGENPPPAATGTTTGGTPDTSTPVVAKPAVEPAPVNPGPANPGPTATATPSEGPKVPATAPAPVAPPVVNPASIPDTTPSVLPTAPAVTAPVVHAKDVPIYEIAKDGKTYVFTSIDAMNAFNTGGKHQPVMAEKPNFTGSGITIVIEAADEAQAAQMTASYTKLHPVAPK